MQECNGLSFVCFPRTISCNLIKVVHLKFPSKSKLHLLPIHLLTSIGKRVISLQLMFIITLALIAVCSIYEGKLFHTLH